MIMSESTRSDVIDLVRHLLVACGDGIEGYRRAAEDVTSKTLQRFLNHEAAEREEIAAVLTNLLVTLGYKPPHHGSFRGAIHRRCLDAISASKERHDGAILHECQRGERATVTAFMDALDHELPEDVRGVLRTQLDRIFRATEALDAAADVQRNQAVFQ
jgi:uncharacterized protein (TIGR02284 family)